MGQPSWVKSVQASWLPAVHQMQRELHVVCERVLGGDELEAVQCMVVRRVMETLERQHLVVEPSAAVADFGALTVLGTVVTDNLGEDDAGAAANRHGERDLIFRKTFQRH